MQINWNGLGSFTVVGKPFTGDVTIVTDPYDASVGMKFPRNLAASIVVSSHVGEMANNIKEVAGEDAKHPFVIDHAGEFEVKGVFVTGVRAVRKDGADHTIYRIDLEDVSIGFLGALDRVLTDKEVEALGTVDVLILPVGGGSVIDKSIASDITAQIEPRLVIPSHFAVKGLKEKFESVQGFCEEVSCSSEESKKLKLTRNSLPQEDMQVTVLSR